VRTLSQTLESLEKVGFYSNTLEKEATEMSNFARKSEMTKISRVAEVSASIPVGDTSRAISTFSTVFDRLYDDFSEQIVKEYAQMRNSYM